MRSLIIAIACGVVAHCAVAETHTGPGSSRSVQDSSGKRLNDLVNACLAGRPFPSSRSLAVQQASPQLPIYRLDPPTPPRTEIPKGPFLRENPREQPEFPGEQAYSECLNYYSKTAYDFFACPQVLTTCRAETIDGGKKKIRPLIVDDGNPCSAHDSFMKAACGRGIKHDEFKSGDLSCGPTQFHHLDTTKR